MDESELMIATQPLIREAVYSFCSKYPRLDPEELFGDCTIHVLKIVRKYDTSKPLENWIRHCISRHLTNRVRRRKWVRAMSKSELETITYEPPAGTRWSLTWFLNQLTDNSKRVVYYCLARKPDRLSLSKTLREEMQFPLEEIVRIIKEIRSVL